MLKEPLRQLRDVFWVLNQVANPKPTHIDSMFSLTSKRSTTATNTAAELKPGLT
jgi:hypothetical protein